MRCFANFFRYKLLLEKGGWFVDSDTICMRPFDFDNEYVLFERGHQRPTVAQRRRDESPPRKRDHAVRVGHLQSVRAERVEMEPVWSDVAGKSAAGLFATIFRSALGRILPHPLFGVGADSLTPACTGSSPSALMPFICGMNCGVVKTRTKTRRIRPAAFYEQLKQRYLS